MCGDHQQAAPLLHEPLGPFDGLVPRVVAPVLLSDKTRDEDQIHREHRKLLEALLARPPYPLFALFREACVKVVQGAFSASMVVFPQQPTEESGGIEIRLDAEHVDDDAKNPHGEVDRVIPDGVVFLLFLLWRLLDHR